MVTQTREAPADGSDRKKVKFFDLQESLALANYEVSVNELLELVKELKPSQIQYAKGWVVFDTHTFVELKNQFLVKPMMHLLSSSYLKLKGSVISKM